MAKKTAAKKTVAKPRTPSADTQTPEVASPATPASAQQTPLGSKARAMRDRLASQLKVRVYIPLAPGEKQGVTQSVVLNGYPLYIRKGDYVEVPEAVADVLEAKLKHKMSVENHPDRIKSDGKVNLVSYGN